MFFEKPSRTESSQGKGRSSEAMRAPFALIALAAAALMAAPMALMTGCSPAAQPAASSASSSQAASVSSAASSSAQQSASSDDDASLITVNVTVNASAVQEEGWDAYLRGINGPISLPEGSTAYDALMATDADVTEDDGYVTAIDGLRTGEFGANSGWMYSVNDENPFTAAREYVLADGDSVRWYYSR